VQSTICTICGKSSFEEVTAPVEAPRQKWWTTLENNELRKAGVTVVILACVVGVMAFVLTRPDTTPVATELPPPASTTTAPPSLEPSGQAPSIAGGIRPSSLVVPGVPREVGEGLSPWQSPPPIDFVTGQWLDEELDFTADIARVDELLAVFPVPWALVELDPPQLLTFDGVIDVASIETSQPFAARTIRRAQDGSDVGELWLIASSGTDAGNAYLAAARARWDLAAALDQFSPEVGVRLWRLGGDESINLWASDVDRASLVIIQAPVSVAPVVLTDSLKAWRRAIAAQ
jgi:hypothetical protein